MCGAGMKIIGGMFGMDLSEACKEQTPSFLTGRTLFLVNARSGIRLLVLLLRPRQVWLPSYLCKTMISAIDTTCSVIRFYPVNSALTVSSLEWLNETKKNDLVVFIDYFGFPSSPECMLAAKSQGCLVLEDACQALLSEQVGAYSDFALYSPRKFLGVPDGGVLKVNCDLDLSEVSLMVPPARWWLDVLRCTILRTEFDRHGGDRSWFHLYRKSDSEAPVGSFRMSELSKMLLETAFDYCNISDVRRRNYSYLLGTLEKVALMPQLPADVVPLGFPIRLKARDIVRQHLFESEIYPPVHWDIKGIVPERFSESHQLAREIMTIPCDQRYDLEDMRRVAEAVANAMA